MILTDQHYGSVELVSIVAIVGVSAAAYDFRVFWCLIVSVLIAYGQLWAVFRCFGVSLFRCCDMDHFGLFLSSCCRLFSAIPTKSAKSGLTADCVADSLPIGCVLFVLFWE